MASSVEIANRALSMLGESRITSLLDNNKPARAMNARFALLRDAELAAYPWRFSIKRVQLPASTDVPAWGYSKIYDRPVDDLQARIIGGNYINSTAIGVMYSTTGYASEGAPYEIIEGRIHTNISAPLDYEYHSQVTNTGLFSPLFAEALAARLAVDAAEELTQSNTKQQAAMFTYRKAISTARRSDSIMRPPRERSAGRWVRARNVL